MIKRRGFSSAESRVLRAGECEVTLDTSNESCAVSGLQKATFGKVQPEKQDESRRKQKKAEGRRERQGKGKGKISKKTGEKED